MSVPQGSWDNTTCVKQSSPEDHVISNQSSFLKENKGTIILISGVAFVIIGSLVSAGVLIHLDINTIAQWSLLGVSGGTFLVSMAVGGVVHCLKCQKPEEEPTSVDSPKIEAKQAIPSSPYRMVTWNVATLADYGGLRAERRRREKSQDPDDYAQLQQQLDGLPAKRNETFNSYTLQLNALKTDDTLEQSDKDMKIQELRDKRAEIVRTEQEQKKSLSDRSNSILQNERTTLFKDAFTQFGNLDFGCLQESDHMDEEQLEAILPEGYSFYSCEYEVGDKTKKIMTHTSTLFWNTAKFDRVNTANMDPRSSKDAIVLLQDKENGTTICVGSGYLKGFNLADSDEGKSAGAIHGDKDTSYDLKTMDLVKADLYVFAGDFNVTQEHYPARLDIIREHGYTNDASDMNPTVHDANLKEEDGKTKKAVKLDYIFAKGGEGAKVEIRSSRVVGHDLEDYVNRPSDHLPVKGTITITRSLTV